MRHVASLYAKLLRTWRKDPAPPGGLREREGREPGGYLNNTPKDTPNAQTHENPGISKIRKYQKVKRLVRVRSCKRHTDSTKIIHERKTTQGADYVRIHPIGVVTKHLDKI